MKQKFNMYHYFCKECINKYENSEEDTPMQLCDDCQKTLDNWNGVCECPDCVDNRTNKRGK